MVLLYKKGCGAGCTLRIIFSYQRYNEKTLISVLTNSNYLSLKCCIVLLIAPSMFCATRLTEFASSCRRDLNPSLKNDHKLVSRNSVQFFTMCWISRIIFGDSTNSIISVSVM